MGTLLLLAYSKVERKQFYDPIYLRRQACGQSDERFHIGRIEVLQTRALHYDMGKETALAPSLPESGKRTYIWIVIAWLSKLLCQPEPWSPPLAAVNWVSGSVNSGCSAVAKAG